jgi:hypothetical protein
MAKFRSDYITNSSSSSFIVAKRNDCTKEDIIQAISGGVKEWYAYATQYRYDLEKLSESDMSEEEIIQVIINKFATELWDLGSMTLDNWVVESLEASSEGCNLDCFIYENGGIYSEKFQIG